MILKGNSRANGAELAVHLMKDENEHIEVAELTNFAAHNLMEAFLEVQAISRATRAKKYLYSLSINPPSKENATREQFEDAISRAEQTLGLSGQSRAVVYHTKQGRTHCHVVWSRIDTNSMKAIKLTYPKRKLNALSLDLFITNGWEIPAGFLDGQEADPMNYTYQEYHEAKRGGRNAKHLKHNIKTSWQTADNRQSFESALERNGLFLAGGDRRGFVCVDYEGNTYSLSRWAGVTAKDLRAQLGDPEYLPGVDEIQAMVAGRMTPKLREFVEEITKEALAELQGFETQKDEMVLRHREERAMLTELQDRRWTTESSERANRFATGLKGLWHRVTGKHGQIARDNSLEAERCLQRDKTEWQDIKDRQGRYRQQLQHHIETAHKGYSEKLDSLYLQLADYAKMGKEPELHRDQNKMVKQRIEKTISQFANYEFEQ